MSGEPHSIRKEDSFENLFDCSSLENPMTYPYKRYSLIMDLGNSITASPTKRSRSEYENGDQNARIDADASAVDSDGLARFPVLLSLS